VQGDANALALGKGGRPPELSTAEFSIDHIMPSPGGQERCSHGKGHKKAQKKEQAASPTGNKSTATRGTGKRGKDTRVGGSEARVGWQTSGREPKDEETM